MEDLLLRIEDLHTYFYLEEGIVKAVNGVDLSVKHGETLGLVGESGCGKSVTALSIMRLLAQQGRIMNGQIVFDNKDLRELNEVEMRNIRGNNISMIFQEPMTSLNPVFRIGYQIAEGIQLHQGVSKREAKDKAVEMLHKVRIPDPERRIKEYPHQLSGGMRQRVMIAMALSCNPKMIIADEPTTALDVTIQAQILDLMNQLKEEFGTSIILITHDLGVISEMAESVAVMYLGKIMEYADVVELFRNTKHPYTMGLMKSIPKMSGSVPEDRMLETIPGVVPGLLDLPRGCSFQERCSQDFGLCREENPPLLEVSHGHLVRCWHYAKL